MTREEAKRLSDVLKAYSEGKIIQYQENGKHRYSDLRFYDFPDQDNISLETQEYNYRIKPEPKYRLFESQEECWNEMLKHQPFGWLREKVNKKEMIHISRVFDASNDTLITLSINEGRNYNSSYFFRTYTFADGTPFGIKLELL